MPFSSKLWGALPWADRQILKRRQVEALERLASLLETSIAERRQQHSEHMAMLTRLGIWLKPR
jgi:hypothetical protein